MLQTRKPDTTGEPLQVENEFLRTEVEQLRRERQAAQERAEELSKANQALQRAVAQLAQVQDVRLSIDTVLQSILEQTGATSGALFRYDPHTATVQMQIFLRHGERIDIPSDPRMELWRRAFATSEFVDGWRKILSLPEGYFVEQVTPEEPDFAQGVGAWHVAMGHQSVASFPLMCGDEPLGFIGLAFAKTFALTAEKIELVRALAQQATLALEITRLAEEAKQVAIARERDRASQIRAEELEKVNATLRQSVATLSQQTDLGLFLTETLGEIVRQMNATNAFLLAVDEESRMARLHLFYNGKTARWGMSGEELPLFATPFSVDITPAFDIMCETHQPICASRTPLPIPKEQFAFPGGLEYMQRMGASDAALITLRAGYRVIGTLHLQFTHGTVLREEDEPLFTSLSQQAALAMRLTELAEEAKQTAIAREQEQALIERSAELAKANAILQAEIVERKRAEQVSRGQTEAMVQALNVLAAEPMLDAFLGHVLRAIATQLETRMCALYLHDASSDTLFLRMTYHEGEIAQGAEQLGHPSAVQPFSAHLNGFWQVLVESRSAVIIPDIETSPLLQHHQWLSENGVRSLLIVPLLLGTEVIGCLGVRSKERRGYAPEEIELAQALAHQITLAINTTRLAEQGRHNAVLEERNRMAREIHDTLAQGFTGVVMQIGAATRYLTEDPETALAHLGTARDLATEALTEARRSVRALRPKALEAGSLRLALEEIVAQMRTHQDTLLFYHTEGQIFALPEEWEQHTLRIGQEALTNAVRHANATRITLDLTYTEDQLCLHITDNGTGFDLQSEAAGYGLIGMRERVRQMKAHLDLETAPGIGTRITLRIAKPTN